MPPGALAHRPLRGALLLTLGLLLLSCMDAAIKYLATSYEVPLIVAARYMISLLLLTLILAPTQKRRLVRTRRTGLVLLRAACLALASLLVGFALQRMPLAETTAINFFAPLVVLLVAGPLLGERIGAIGWVAAGLGVLGVLLIVRPGGGLDGLGVALAFAVAATSVVYQLLSRLLAASEQTSALLFYSLLVGAILFGLALPWFSYGHWPSGSDLILFLGVGVAGGLGHYLYTAAYRYASASTLAPLQYSQLVWAGLLGWLLFGHVPPALTMLGMAIVVAAGLLIALRPTRAPAPDYPSEGPAAPL